MSVWSHQVSEDKTLTILVDGNPTTTCHAKRDASMEYNMMRSLVHLFEFATNNLNAMCTLQDIISIVKLVEKASSDLIGQE